MNGKSAVIIRSVAVQVPGDNFTFSTVSHFSAAGGGGGWAGDGGGGGGAVV